MQISAKILVTKSHALIKFVALFYCIFLFLLPFPSSIIYAPVSQRSYKGSLPVCRVCLFRSLFLNLTLSEGFFETKQLHLYTLLLCIL